MNLGGFILKLVHSRLQDKVMVCERCGLQYPVKLFQCPHCTELDEAGLTNFKKTIKERGKAVSNIGSYFLYAAFVLLALVIFAFMFL
jgi:hypothetical protein